MINIRKSAFAILLAGVLGLVSCESYLDKSPDSDIKATEPFKNFNNFQGFTEELYSCIPVYTAYAWHCSWNLGDDEIWSTKASPTLFGGHVDRGDFWKWSAYSSPFGTGNSTTTNTEPKDKGNVWGFCWYGIRKANVGIANLDLLLDATQEEKDLIAGQLYFFRAWFHFELMRYWGGLPYVDDVLAGSIKEARLSYQECADKAAEDFKKAADLLPIDWDDLKAGEVTKGNNNQRINKIMALAYLGKNYLYAGSPLMNEVSGGNAEYNVEYCDLAAEALGEALALSESTGRYKLADFKEYSELFYSLNSDKLPGLEETLFWENPVGNKARFRWNQINDYIPPGLSTGGYCLAPAANYVFYNYGMANGLPINEDRDITKADAESGYDPEHPWKGRDPRFYSDIMVDGERCSASAETDPKIQFASLYTGGYYRVADGSKINLSGLINTKFKPRLAEKSTESTTMNNGTVLSLMRLADVYLMYAEASFVANGATGSADSYSKTAIDAFNAVRERAGVDPLADKYKTSFDGFMGELQRERAVELSFEGHRFCDLRRWKLLDKKPYTLKTSIEFERDPNGPVGAALADAYQDAKVLNLREQIQIERQFTAKHYWFPFLIEDVNLYPEFTQNPGW